MWLRQVKIRLKWFEFRLVRFDLATFWRGPHELGNLTKANRYSTSLCRHSTQFDVALVEDEIPVKPHMTPCRASGGPGHRLDGFSWRSVCIVPPLLLIVGLC